MIKAVIFDMDGLIVDTEPIESESLEILLSRYGKTPIYNENGLIHVAGIAGLKHHQAIKEKYGIQEDYKVLRRKKRRIYSTLILRKELISLEGFDYLIKILKDRKIKIAVASNRYINHTKLVVNKMGLKDVFDVIAGPGKNIQHKPSPDIYLATARKLKTKPSNCLVLEDSETGITAGKQAGMKVIAVPNRYTKNQDLMNANLVVNSLKDIKWNTILNI